MHVVAVYEKLRALCEGSSGLLLGVIGKRFSCNIHVRTVRKAFMYSWLVILVGFIYVEVLLIRRGNGEA